MHIASWSRGWVLGWLTVLVLLSISAVAADDDPVQASRAEGGLLVYSNVAAYNWEPVVQAFRKRYPWIGAETLDLGPAEAFERYYSETSVGKASADLIAVAAPESWLRFLRRGGPAPYVSREDSALPAWSRPAPGLYTLSADPLVLVYNKLLLPEELRPSSLADLAAAVARQPAKFRRRLTTYDATSHPFAFALHWAYVNHAPERAWSVLDALGPDTRPEGGGATMVEKITAGEYVGAYFVSGVTFFRRLKEESRARLLDWKLVRDGTPVMIRGIAITRESRSPNSARLFLDFVLSREGQIAVGAGGLTPYRSDVKRSDVPYLTYDAILEEIGADNVIFVGYDPHMLDEHEQFLERWKQAYHISR